MLVFQDARTMRGDWIVWVHIMQHPQMQVYFSGKVVDVEPHLRKAQIHLYPLPA
jgi:hypothetical protein